MDASARALHSFLDEDEEWVESWAVAAVGRGLTAATPRPSGEETVGLTDRRLLWLDENLESVALADVTSVDADAVDHARAPPLVRAGGAALVFGALGSAALLFALSFPLATGLVPFGVGVVAFVATLWVARARAEASDRVRRHRLRIEADGEVLTVWCDEPTCAEIADRIREES